MLENSINSRVLRPRLRSDLYMVPHGRGTYLRSGRREMILTGASTYRWLDRLAPRLDGTSTVDELTAGLSEDRRRLVRMLIGVLHEHDLVRDVSGDRPHGLTEVQLAEYRPQIAFVEALHDSPEWRFAQFRATRPVVVGAGHAPAALARTLLDLGAAEVIVAGPASYTGIWANQVRCVPVEPGDDIALAEVVAGADAVLQVTDDVAGSLRLARTGRRLARPVMQAVVLDGEAWICPSGAPDHPSADWESVLLRLRTGPTGQTTRPATDTVALTGPVCAMVSAQLALAYFRFVTGDREEGRSRAAHPPLRPARAGTGDVLRIDLATFTTHRHTFLTHPLARDLPIDPADHWPDGRGPALAALAALSGPPADGSVDRSAGPTRAATRVAQQDPALGPDTDDEFSRRARRLIDDRLGVLGEVGEGDLTQVPLRVARATVANPAGLALHLQQRVVCGASTDADAARLAAGRRAVETYCAVAVDTRLLCGPDGTVPDTPPTVDTGYVWGWCPVDRALRLVPAGRIFSAARLSEVVSGRSRADGVAGALTALCLTVTVDALAHRHTVAPAIDLAAVPLDDAGARCHRSLVLAHWSPAAYDVSMPGGLPTFAICVADRTVGYACAPDPVEAIGAGLHTAALAYQAATTGQPQYAPPPVAPLPRRLRGRDPGATLPRPVDPSWQHAARVLAIAGRTPVVVPLDHDPAVTRFFPYVVRAVLADD